MAKKWRELSDLRPGALFITVFGALAVKTDAKRSDGGLAQVVSLQTGLVHNMYMDVRVHEITPTELEALLLIARIRTTQQAWGTLIGEETNG